MKEFFAHFFGKGTEIEFTHFSLAHLIPILVMLVIMAAIALFGKHLTKLKCEPTIRMVLAFIMIISEMSYYWRLVGVEGLNPNAADHLPITVCGWAIVFCTFLALTKNQTLFDIAFFWVFAGSIFGLLTPTVITYTGPTRFRYYQFWFEHTMGFITLFYMIFVHKMRPTIKSMIKSYASLMVLGVIAIFANNMLPGANYLYVARPEDTASILDFLPKNYYVRLVIMALAVATLFFVFYLPWFIKDLKVKKLATAGATVTPTENGQLPGQVTITELTAKAENTLEQTESVNTAENVEAVNPEVSDLATVETLENLEQPESLETLEETTEQTFEDVSVLEESAPVLAEPEPSTETLEPVAEPTTEIAEPVAELTEPETIEPTTIETKTTETDTE